MRSPKSSLKKPSLHKVSTREKVAATISVAIILFMVIYWATQIVGVIEILRRAYG